MTASKLNTNEEKKKESVINIETCDDKIVEKKKDTETKPASNSKYYAIILLGSIILIYIGILQIRGQNSSVADINEVVQNEVTTEFSSRDINLHQDVLCDLSLLSTVEIIQPSIYLKTCEQWGWFCKKYLNYDPEDHFDSDHMNSYVIPMCVKHFGDIPGVVYK